MEERSEGPDLTSFEFNDVKETTLRNLTILQGWENSYIPCGDLQYVESEVIIATISELALQHGIAAPLVHELIIVPLSAKELAINVLTIHFEQMIGVTPLIEG